MNMKTIEIIPELLKEGDVLVHKSKTKERIVFIGLRPDNRMRLYLTDYGFEYTFCFDYITSCYKLLLEE